MSDPKQFAGPARDPADQFQIGEQVLYLPEGIFAVIEGYDWAESIGALPYLIAYQLSCGISVPGNAIARIPFKKTSTVLA